MLQHNKIIIFILLLLLSFELSYAVDPSVLYGKWEGKLENKSIELDLNKNNMATIMINNQLFIKEKYDYVYGKDYYPFVSLFFNKNETDYHLYLLIGTSNGINFDLLRGFFEKSLLINEQKEIEKLTSYRIDLTKVE